MNEIIGIKQLDKIIYLNKQKIIILYFGATWCKPCQKLKNNLSNPQELIDMKDLFTCYIDIDNENNKNIVDIYNVEHLPTIFFIDLDENNNIIILHKIIGYDWFGIKFTYAKIKKKVL
jgi:thiol:disulfide interchange protein